MSPGMREDVSRMPESYSDAWRRLDEDFASRTRKATALQIEGTLLAHDWEGGHRCRCGRLVTSPREWGQHLLELALLDEAEQESPVRDQTPKHVGPATGRHRSLA